MSKKKTDVIDSALAELDSPVTPNSNELVTMEIVEERNFERRAKVGKMKQAGLSVAEMLSPLKEVYSDIDETTIRADLKRLEREYLEKIHTFDTDKEAGRILTEYETLYQLALQEFHESAPGSTNRAKFLDVAKSTLNERQKYLQSIGKMTKVADERVIQHKHDAIVEKLSPDQMREIENLLIQASMGQIGAPVALIQPAGTVIDAECVTIPIDDQLKI